MAAPARLNLHRPAKARPHVLIVTPALAAANNGNSHTALRWQRMLAPVARVQVALAWQGEPVDALIVLHARRSAASVARWREARAGAPLALVLTGTDLYRDLAESDVDALHSVECASHLVVLQPEALARLDAPARARARVILQSASRLLRHDSAARSYDFVAVGHLRDEKDPQTLMHAAGLLDEAPGARIIHIGAPLDAALGAAATATAAECPHYRWLGALPAAAARRWIARARVFVHMSRIEGGANVVIEAVRSGVPVLASRIDGNVGLLGRGYGGYFPVGDAAALAASMRRCMAQPHFTAQLAAQCAAREALFEPAAEAASVRALLADLLPE